MNETHPNKEVMIGVGDVAPDFTLVDHAGTFHTLSESAKPIVLVIYRGDW
jgi:peroxiredoxin